jgi:hypothetical protein
LQAFVARVLTAAVSDVEIPAHEGRDVKPARNEVSKRVRP